MSVVTVDNENFEAEVINSEKSVLADFWAQWCGPCKMFAPVIHEIADEHPEIKVVKIDIDNSPELAQKYGIMSIPTLILFKNGEPADMSVGLLPKSAVLKMISK